MDIKNTEKAMELIPLLEQMKEARALLNDPDAQITISVGGGYGNSVTLKGPIRLNFLHVANCEYERVRKEVELL